MIRVLMVDDDPVNLEITTIFLERSGDVTVDASQSAKNVIAELKASCYDVIISDYAMPEMDGITFLKTIRGQGLEIPFILFTGKSREEVVIEALNNGADYYLQKDGDPKVLYTELLHQIKQATEREKDKKALRQSEERYRSFLQNFRGIAFRYHPNFGPAFIHGQVETISGYTEEELISRNPNWNQLVHPNDIKSFIHIRKNLELLSNYSKKHNYRIIRKDGAVRWVHENIHNICDDSGKPVEIEGTIYDITKRKQANKHIRNQRDLALKLSETTSLKEALKLCMETAMQVSETDCGSIYLINEKRNRLELAYTTGLSNDFIHAVKDRKRPLRKLRSDKNAKPVYIQYQDEDLPGQKAREQEGLRAMAILPVLHGDHVVGYYSVASHTTDKIPPHCRNTLETIGITTGNAVTRIQAVEKLHQTQKDLQNLFDSMEDFVFVLDLKGCIICVNQAVEKLGYSLDELKGHYGQEICSWNMIKKKDPESPETMDERFKNCTIPLKTKDGIDILVEAEVTRGRWGDKEVIFSICRDVTKRKEIEKRLRFNQFAVDNAADAIFWIKPDASFAYFNRATSKMLGYSQKELLSMSVFDLDSNYRPDNWDIEWGKLKKYNYNNIESHHLAKDGNLVPVEISGKFLDFEGQEYNCSIVRDISERKRAEYILEKTEERLNLALEGGGLGTWDWNITTNEVVFDEGWAEMIGHSLYELEGRLDDWEKRIHPDDIRHVKKVLEEHLQGKTPYYESEHRLVCKDGRFTWVHDRGKVVEWDEKSNPIRMAGIHQDITEKKRLEQDLLVTNYAISNSLNGIIIADIKGCAKYANDSFLNMWGYESKEQILGKPAIQLWQMVDKAPKVIAALEKTGNWSGEIVAKKLDGTYFDVNLTATMITNENGETVGMMASFVDITEYKIAERELRKSEERLRAIFEGSENVSFVITDIQNSEPIVTEFSPGAEKIFGYKREEIIEKPAYILHQPKYIPKLSGLYQKIRASRKRFSTETRLLRKSGEMFPVLFTIYPLFDKNGEMHSILEVSIEITEQKKIEEALKASEEKLRVVLNSLKEVVLYMDADQRVIWANRAAEKAKGKFIEQIIGKICYEVTFNRDTPCEGCATTEALKTGSSKSREVVKCGNKTWLVNANPVKDEEGNVIGVVNAELDITDLKTAEKALQDNEERLNLAIESANLGIWDWNLSDVGKILLSNRCAEMMGFSDGEFSRSEYDWEQNVHLEDFNFAKKRLMEHLEGKSPCYDSIHRVRCKDGHWIWAKVQGKVVERNEVNKPTRMIGLIQDVTEMQQYQMALKEANEKLNLMSCVTRHDLLNLTLSIAGYAQLLCEMKIQDAVAKEYIQRIMELTAKVKQQVIFTKDYQQMGLKAPNWQPIKDLVTEAMRSASLKDIKLEIKTDLPEVFADPLLEKVFSNLIDNAKRHGQRTTKIEVSFQVQNDQGRGIIIVENDGIGIPKEIKSQIFERGFGKNNGYGLFLVKEILGITGMKIEETGNEDKGARFEIKIPKENYRIG